MSDDAPDPYIEGYRAGYVTGYAEGTSDGRFQGYADAKHRAFRAVDNDDEARERIVSFLGEECPCGFRFRAERTPGPGRSRRRTPTGRVRRDTRTRAAGPGA